MSKNEIKRKDRIINLSKKMTEAEWAYSAQAFFEKITPLWFEWLGWAFTTGGVAYLAKRTDSMPLKILEAISYVVITLYFLYFFASIRIEPYHSWADGHSTKLKRFLAFLPYIILASALAFGARVLVNNVIEQVQITK